MNEILDQIIHELERQPLQNNRYRKSTGLGRSQTFGVVFRRSSPPDYSRWCWKRAYLYSLLIEFGDKYVDVPFNAITLNQNYKCLPHRDTGNEGESTIIAFGNYTGGALLIHEGDTQIHDIKMKSLTRDFSKLTHSVADFSGERYSLVFYQRPINNTLPLPSVKLVNGAYCFYRGGELITARGLPHPLRGH